MLGSHNTFTYMKPTKWWMYIFQPFVKCQSSTLEEQVAKGVNLVDIRLRYNDGWKVCHGLVEYCYFSHALHLIIKNNIKNVRILFEDSFEYSEGNKTTIDCILKSYMVSHKLVFYECRNKFDWSQPIGNYPTLEPLSQIVGSMQSWYGRIIPKLYTIFNKKKINNIYNNKDINKRYLFDFIK